MLLQDTIGEHLLKVDKVAREREEVILKQLEQNMCVLDLKLVYDTHMNITYKSNNNVVYSCKYHVVWCPKYRRKILTNGIDKNKNTITVDKQLFCVNCRWCPT